MMVGGRRVGCEEDEASWGNIARCIGFGNGILMCLECMIPNLSFLSNQFMKCHRYMHNCRVD